MNVFRFDLHALKADDRDFFCEMIPYLSEYIHETRRRGDVLEIEYDGVTEEHVASRVERLTEMLAAQLRDEGEVTVKNLLDATDVTPACHDDVFEELVSQGQVVRLNTGSFACSGLFLTVMRYFERRVSAFAEEVFGTFDTYVMPDLIPIAEYERGGYFDTFPHYTMFETTLRNDIEVIERFSREKTRDRTIFSCLAQPKNVLRTAACMPLYPILEHRRISPSSPAGFVVSGRCFRNEKGNLKTLERLCEFTMKELVCIGTPEQTTRFLDRCRELWLSWQEVFHLNLRIDTANDSFFASNYRKLRMFQLLGDSKVECRWLVPSSGDYVSCSSANAHRTHFTKTYDIRTAGTDAYCHSSCFAFGIERLAFCLLSQLGLDPEAWSEPARKEVEAYVDL